MCGNINVQEKLTFRFWQIRPTFYVDKMQVILINSLNA